MRGTVIQQKAWFVTKRITPACAGNRKILGTYATLDEDHPRVCGEQQGAAGLGLLRLGSPPRVRGTEPHFHGLLRGHGITPACAGNSTKIEFDPWKEADHPRVCGEQYACKASCDAILGSPPRVRGTVGRVLGGPVQAGITPACAGNSHSGKASEDFHGDHPRVCGEQFLPCQGCQARLGSPPRVRGTVHPFPGGAVGYGITPACAGNSSLVTCNPRLDKDHPRVCGEQHIAGPPGPQYIGSPPRVRGTDRYFCKK